MSASSEAEEQRDEAHRQKEKAEHNYQLARKAVDRYHTEVSESVLLHEPGLEPLRKKLLEAAREFYEQFVQERQEDPGVQDELGKSLFRLAQISGEIDSRFKAIEIHRRALTVFTALAAEHPGVAIFQADLAACQHHLGRLYRLTDQIAKSEASYQEALAGWEKLTASTGEPAGTARYQPDLARTLLGLGNVCQQSGRFDQARDFYQRALRLRQQLARESPDISDYQRDLAVSHKNLAACCIARREFDEAEANYRQASAIQEKLVHDFPQVKQYQDDLAGTYASLGNLYSRPEQSAKAELCLEKAAAIWSRLAESHPAVTDYALALAGVYNNLANHYRAAGRVADAERSYRLARDIREKLSRKSREVPAHQADLAKLYRNLANLYRADSHFDDAETTLRTALDIQETLVREHADIPEYQADLAASQNDVGLVLQAAGRPREAEAAFRKAIAAWEKLTSVANPAAEHLIGLGTSCQNLGDLIRDRGDSADALDWYARALQALEPESHGGAHPAGARDALRNTYWGRADALTRLGRHKQALADWDRAIALADPKSRGWFQLFRLAALARTGDHAKATEEAGKLILPPPQTGEALYKLAAVYALATRAAQRDEELRPDQRNKLAEQYATRAVELLTRATASAEPWPGLSKLEKDPDFEGVRSNAGFKKVLETIKKQRGETIEGK